MPALAIEIRATMATNAMRSTPSGPMNSPAAVLIGVTVPANTSTPAVPTMTHAISG